MSKDKETCVPHRGEADELCSIPISLAPMKTLVNLRGKCIITERTGLDAPDKYVVDEEKNAAIEVELSKRVVDCAGPYPEDTPEHRRKVRQRYRETFGTDVIESKSKWHDGSLLEPRGGGNDV